ncbi:MAG TPA: low temperature requirement protein A [Micromonosporaceae bacterium]
MTDAPTVKRVTWAELFFDLVFVVAVTRVSGLLSSHHGWTDVLRALIVFVPVYWTWVGVAVQANLRDMDRPTSKLLLFAVALAGVFMALSLQDAYGSRGLAFAAAYWVGRIVLGAGAFRHGWRVGLLNPVGISVVLTGPLLIVGALVPGWWRVAIWAAAALIDLSTPRLLRRRLVDMQLDADHFAERFGLFVLIALGETVASVGTSIPASRLGVAGAFGVAAAFVMICGLWWVYFNFAADAMRHSMATAKIQADISRLVLSYGHLAFIASIIVVAVGLHTSIEAPTHPLGWGIAALLYGGAATYLATFGFTRWTMFRLVSWTRLSAAAVVLVLLPLAAVADALAAVTVLAVVLIVLNVIEYMRVGRIGWRALLAGRAATSAAP